MEGDQFAPLREASTKLLIGQIPQLPTIEGGCGIYVWVQGTVVDIAKNGNQVTLDDGTGLLVAENVASVIKDPWLQLGKLYVNYAVHCTCITGYQRYSRDVHCSCNSTLLCSSTMNDLSL